MARISRAWLGLLLCLIATALLTACEVQKHAVHYEVSGTAAEIGVTYRNASGATEQRDVREPWSLDLQAQTGTLLILRAQNKTASGTVSCRIVVDGQVLKEGESSGAFKFVDCSGVIPFPTPAAAGTK
jgi:hypothetical protein